MYTYVAVCTQCTGQLRYVALHVGHAAPAHYAYIVCYKIVLIPACFLKMAVTVQEDSLRNWVYIANTVTSDMLWSRDQHPMITQMVMT